MCILSNCLLKVEGFWRQGKDRTLESNADDATDYETEGGGDRTKLKNFNNMEKQVRATLFTRSSTLSN
jgi:hypothetical protein